MMENGEQPIAVWFKSLVEMNEAYAEWGYRAATEKPPVSERPLAGGLNRPKETTINEYGFKATRCFGLFGPNETKRPPISERPCKCS